MKITKKELKSLISSILNEESYLDTGLKYILGTSEDKSDVFGSKPEDAFKHAKEYGKAYYIYVSNNDGKTYVDLYENPKDKGDYKETELTQADVEKQNEIKRFYQGN